MPPVKQSFDAPVRIIAEPALQLRTGGQMPRVTLDLENAADLSVVGSTGWRIASGLVPGEPNQGLVAELRAVDARLPDYDDSSWEIDGDIQERRSVGFTFAWYRLKISVPEQVKARTWQVRGSGLRPMWTITAKYTSTVRLTGTNG